MDRKLWSLFIIVFVVDGLFAGFQSPFLGINQSPSWSRKIFNIGAPPSEFNFEQPGYSFTSSSSSNFGQPTYSSYSFEQPFSSSGGFQQSHFSSPNFGQSHFSSSSFGDDQSSPITAYPFRNLPFSPPNFKTPLFPHFKPFGSRMNFGFDISRDMENRMKPLRMSQAKSRMQSGTGGITIVESPGKILLKRDGTTFECLGNVVPSSPFCNGQLKRFQINSREDYCHSERYSQLGNMLCITHNDQNGVQFSGVNGKYSCSGSDERAALLINLQQYQQMCGRLPWDVTYYYFPEVSSPFHVRLPNPDLGCTQNHKDVCIFKKDRQLPLF